MNLSQGGISKRELKDFSEFFLEFFEFFLNLKKRIERLEVTP